MPPASKKQPPALPPGDEGFVRLPSILAVFPVSQSSWWLAVAAGRYPKPVRISPHCSAWRVAEIRALLKARAAEAYTPMSAERTQPTKPQAKTARARVK